MANPEVDSLNLEAGMVSNLPNHSQMGFKATLILAFQSIGVIYGDIGTSPLYTLSGTFPNGMKNAEDMLGVLSLIYYTLLLSPVIKYMFVVLNANDNGDGGTFALYSKICRYARISLVPNQQAEDRELSNYTLVIPSDQSRAQKIREKLEHSKVAKMVLFLITILGVSLVIGDGVMTPCISVLSAVGGIKRSAKFLNQDAIVGISVTILIILFSVQRFGTDKVGYSFAPILCLWFCFNIGIGLYNVFTYDIGILRALNPKYIINYFERNGKDAWISLGGVILCITGTEAMFADLGHFSVRSVQISFMGVVFPSIICAYSGQAAYLYKNPTGVTDAFYASVPDALYWPTFVVAVCASIIASQAMISGAFAIISQSLRLGCFPPVKVVHTSAKYEGQVYIPEINFILMTACVIVTITFRTTTQIGNAYGIAVVGAEAITTFMVTIIMLFIWKSSMWKIALFFVVLGTMEATYLSAVLFKFTQGGYLPLAISFVVIMIMGLWHYVHHQRYMFELKNKVSSDSIRDLALNPNITRIPGIGLLYSELVQGIPPIFPHFISNIPSIHSVLVFVSIKYIPISKVAMAERFLFRQVQPRDYRMFRCVVRYGYKDNMEGPEEFEHQLVEHLKEFICNEYYILQTAPTEEAALTEEVTFQQLHAGPLMRSGLLTNETEESLGPNYTFSRSSGSIHLPTRNNSLNRMVTEPVRGIEEEIQFIQKAMDQGVVYLLGETEVAAEPNSSCFKKIAVNYVYDFLRKNFRQGGQVMSIPRSRLLRVGMLYEI
ncbi:hypothetical protein AQUCO_05500079v1 [Aquilegia coerulea]|uniref:Potassium transporter n=1 Tax=Aquilegia coerulea TaxID=218851 RepID=A0A2G5CH26_AQUCA|nr:hypothetical protein AQUCO_05500079v1 [Aquilegia coerulea]